MVTWASGGALKALCAGVPVFYDFPQWIGRLCCLPMEWGDKVTGSALLEYPLKGPREAMLDRLAWAQWDVQEIASGNPFRLLMMLYHDGRAANAA